MAELDQEVEARATSRDLDWFARNRKRWYYLREPIEGEGAAGAGSGCACVLVVQVHPGADGVRVRAGLSGWPTKVKALEIATAILRRMSGGGASA